MRLSPAAANGCQRSVCVVWVCAAEARQRVRPRGRRHQVAHARVPRLRQRRRAGRQVRSHLHVLLNMEPVQKQPIEKGKIRVVEKSEVQRMQNG